MNTVGSGSRVGIDVDDVGVKTAAGIRPVPVHLWEENSLLLCQADGNGKLSSAA